MTGVVAALGAEARTLGPQVRRPDGLYATRSGTLVAVSGMGSAAAAGAARALVDAGAVSLVSWGMAGGLDPALAAGTICLPKRVVSADGTASFATSAEWCAAVAAAAGRSGHVVSGPLLAGNSALAEVAAKAAAFRATGAVAVDMESLAIAAIAAAHALPFLAVRVIVDTALDAVPAAVMSAAASGNVRISRIAAGLLRRPGDLLPLLRLAKRYRAAMRALTAVAKSGALTRRLPGDLAKP